MENFDDQKLIENYFKSDERALGESINTVKSRYRRALIILRKFLSKNQ